MKILRKLMPAFLILIVNIQLINAQKKVENRIADSLTVIANSYSRIGNISVLEFLINQKKSEIFLRANDKLAQIPFRYENVNRIYEAVRKSLPTKYAGYSIVCQADNKNIETFYGSTPFNI